MKKDNQNHILQGMPTMLGQFPFPSFSHLWPQSRELPPLNSMLNPQQSEEFNLGIQNAQNPCGNISFQLRILKKITKCAHTDKKHYAKGMCSICYYQRKKMEKVVTCGHTDKPVFARGMCCRCYSSAYKAFKQKLQKKLVEERLLNKDSQFPQLNLISFV